MLMYLSTGADNRRLRSITLSLNYSYLLTEVLQVQQCLNSSKEGKPKISKFQTCSYMIIS